MEQFCGLRTRVENGWSGGYVPVPLTSVGITAKLLNFTAHVTVTQTYVNKEENPIECEYFFPIEEEAAVVDFKAEIEGRTLISKVKKTEEAKKDYDEAVEQGRTGFMMQETRPDILQIKVGHLSPGASCTISLSYIYEVPLEAGKSRLTIPTTISPKYIPPHDGSPEAERIASIKYDFKTPAKLQFSLDACMKSKIESVTSPSHGVVTSGGLERDQNGFYDTHSTLQSTTADLDRDIVILVQCEDPNKSIIFVEENEESKVMMVSLVPKLELKSQPNLDVVFLIDCSGSMHGSSIDLAREAINILLHSLPPSVSFNIVCFGSTYRQVFPHSIPYTDQTLAQAKAAMAELQADLGGTEILAPLKHLLEEKTKAPRRIFILTDGSVSNSAECIKVTNKNNKKNRVFTLGIGSAADRHLVKGLARAGLGTAEFTVEGEMMAPKVLKQLKNCLQPSLKDVSIHWGEGVGPDNSCQAPVSIPPIYNGHRIQIFRLFEKDSLLPAQVGITAEIPSQDTPYTEQVNNETSRMKGNLLHQMFARKLIQGLEENFDEKEEGEVKALVTELSLKYQLMSKYTSFIAVDSKENKTEQVMLQRQVANQVPHGFGFGGPMMCMSAPAPRMMRNFMSAPAPRMMRNFKMNDSPPMAMSFGGFIAEGPAPNRLLRSKIQSSALPPPPPQECGLMDVVDECFSIVSDSGFAMKSQMLRGCETLEEGAQKEINPEKKKMETVLSLISLQTAEGSFRKDKLIFSLCNLKEEEVEKVRGEVEEAVFYTLLVVLLLEKGFQDTRDCWEMVVEKGRNWLNQKNIPDTLNQQIISIL